MKRALPAAGAVFAVFAVCTMATAGMWSAVHLSPTVDRLLDDPRAQLTVAAVFPVHDESKLPPQQRSRPRLQGFPILETRPVADPAERRRIVEELRKGIGGEFGARCLFQPRHALMLRTPTASAEVLICFTCGEVQWSEHWPKHETLPPSRVIDTRLRPLLNNILQRP